MLVVKGVMVKEPQDWVLRLTLLSVGEQGLLAAIDKGKDNHIIPQRFFLLKLLKMSGSHSKFLRLLSLRKRSEAAYMYT